MKKSLIILFIAVLMLLAGCTDSSSSSSSGGGTLTSYRGGDVALTGTFGDNSPPSKVMDIHPFSVRVLLENSGEYDIPDQETSVRLSGISASDFGLADADTMKTLGPIRGYKKQGSNTIEGGKEQVIFNNLKYSGGQLEGIYQTDIFVDLCYPYETRTSARMCVSGDTSYVDSDDQKICDVNSDMKYQNSGGPVHVENIKQSSSGASSLYIQFDIVHKPTSKYAKVARLGSIGSDCRIGGNSVTSTESYNDVDIVKYVVETGIPGLSCNNEGTNSGEVRLYDDKFTVSCTQDTKGQEEHEKPIKITLSYDYFDRISTSLSIEHVNQ